MNLLIGCESSGLVRDAFRARGHNAVSCDLLPSKRPGPHMQCDVFEAIASQKWDAGIFFPPCTYVCGSGIHWNKRRPERAILTAEGVEFARRIWNCGIPKTGMENPIGILSSEIEPPTQIIQPWMFGEDASKATCLWLRGFPPLKPTGYHPPRVVVHQGKWVMRWGNQTDSGQNRLPPSDDRWELRSLTYQGIADAMAAQWGEFELESAS